MTKTIQIIQINFLKFWVIGIFCLLFFPPSLQAAPMSGKYTVGTGSGFNFSSISQSIDSLNTKGVSGPVIIAIDGDTFNEQLTITSIKGASPTNTITFKGKGNSTLIYFTPKSTNRAIVSFNGASHILFDSLHVEAKGTYGIGFNFHNGADSISVQNCYIILPNGASGNKCTGFANYVSNGGSGSATVKSLTIINDSIEGGYEGIRLIGNSIIVNNHLIEQNTIFDFGFIGIHISGSVEVDILANIVISSESTAKSAISMWPTGHSINIVGNDVELGSKVNHTRVFQIAGAPGTGPTSSSNAILVANNFVKYTGSYTSNMTGIYTKHMSYLKIYNNTVRMVSGSGAKSLWLDALSSTSNVKVHNNNLANDVSNGELYRVHRLVSVTNDYNNYYNSNGFRVVYLGTAYTSLSTFQSGSSQAKNGVALNPKFISTADLHIDTANSQFDGRGTPLTEVKVDFDNQNRDSLRPDIGADEFNSGADVSLVNVVAPIPCTNPTPSKPLSVTIKNLGPHTVSGIPVSYQINGGTAVNDIHSGSIASQDSAIHYFNRNGNMKNPGVYKITFYVGLRADQNLSNDTLFSSIPISELSLSLPDSVGACSNQDIVLNPITKAAVSYLWSNNSSQSTVTIKGSSQGIGSSKYWLKVTDAYGCSISDTLKVIFSKAPSLHLGNDTTLCEGASLNLDATNTNASYLWHDQSTNPTFSVDKSGLFYVRVGTGYQCVVSDSIQVDYSNTSLINLGDSIELCEGSSTILRPTGVFTSFLWHDASTNDTFEASKSGLHWVLATDSNGCASSDSVEIVVNAVPHFDLGADTAICFGDSLTVDATSVNSNYKWHDNSKAATYVATSTGTFWVSVTNNKNCEFVDSIHVIVNLNPILLLNDTTICSNEPLSIDIEQNGATYLWSDGSKSSIFVSNKEGHIWVELEDSNGCFVRDSLLLSVNQSPDIELGADTILGLKEIKASPYKLEVKSGYKTYLWSTGDQNDFITIDDSYQIGKHNLSIIVTAENGCQSFDTIQIEIKDNIGIANNPLSDSKIWPNPSKSIFNVSIPSYKGEVKLAVYTSQGHRIAAKTLQLDGKHHSTIDLSNYADGLYFVSVKQMNNVSVQKVVLRK
jgi:hypothetical protein